MRCPVTELERLITDTMAEATGVPSPILAAVVYGGEPVDPIEDIRIMREKLDNLYAAARSDE